MSDQLATHRRILQAANDLQPLPQSVLQLALAIDDPKAVLDTLVGIVSEDQALALHVLREANRAAHAPRERIGNLDRAVMMIGAARVLEVAIRQHVGGQLERGLPHYGHERGENLKHGVAVSRAIEICRTLSTVRTSPDVLCAGLLHDIGKVILDSVFEPGQPETMLGGGASEIDMERELASVDHAEVGAYVIDHWQLPATLSAAVRHHHDPAHSADAAMVCLADHLCDRLLAPEQRRDTVGQDAEFDAALAHLGLSGRLVEIETLLAMELEPADG